MATAQEPEACKAAGAAGPGPVGPEARPATDTDALADAAEEVRAYFVEVRGGAPFLSAADGRRLVAWLEAGVPVARLLVAIDRVAERRRARRVRAPFTLRDLAPELARRRGAARVEPVAPAAGGVGVDALRDRALAAIAALDDPDLEGRGRAACALGRQFFSDAWQALGDTRAAWLAEAAAELDALRDALDEPAFAAACEELARDRLRRQYPELTATRIWEGLGVVLD